MIAFKLAFRNLLGAGLRTWLIVAVLSFAYVVILFYNGMLSGWDRQGRRDTKAWEIGQGQFWHPTYDKYDVFSIQDAHGSVKGEAKKLVDEGKLTPVLIVQATAYPQGRMQGVLLKGIDPNQQILKFPSYLLRQEGDEYTALIGKRMALTTRLKKGDVLLVRWRDKDGTFDAAEIRIADVFKCDVPAVDNGQIWMDLSTLQQMMDMPGEATLLVSGTVDIKQNIDSWIYRDTEFLLAELNQIIKAKKGGSMVMQSMLLIIALLAIFDTQILSIFRRQKEIGTYIALGMTRTQVVGIFTVEGAAHSILATLLGAVYGIPLFLWLGKKGITFGVDDMGITIAETIYPYYSIGLIISTTLFVILSATIVSYLPARRISRMKPTDALKGKIQ